MKRIFSLIILFAIIPGIASALGLGNLELNSALNEPFDGKIKLLSASADELDSLNVELADSDAFARANIARPFILSKLKFKLIRTETGADYIKVSSQDAIREPFLNFLVEVSWSNGRLFREYTVLLDPPMYDSNVRAAEIMTLEPQAASPVAAPVDEKHQVVYAADFDKYAGEFNKPVKPTTSTPVNYGGGDYGPTTASDTLWSIASSMRPDTSVSVNQMMLALLNANPDVFLNNNINGLKRGQILKMPSDAEINAMSQSQALAEVKSQYAAWDQIKGKLGTTVPSRPESSSVAAASETAATKVKTEAATEDAAELRLVGATDKPESTEQVASVDSGAAADLVLAQENIQALTQENLELKDQLQENESLLNDLKRLLELKDDELAALQDQMVAQQTEALLEEAVEVVETAEEQPTETAEEEISAVVEEITEEAVAEELQEEEIVEVIETTEEAAPGEEIEPIDVIEMQPEAESAGIMAMVETYLGPVTAMLGGNPLYAIAALGLLLILIVIAVAMKFKKKPDTEATAEASMSADEFPEFDTDDADLDEAEQELESEAETVLPGAEDENILPEEDDNSEDETYLPGAEDMTEVVSAEEEPSFSTDEEEEDEDPLQEVNTYLAFEQFDQAEEFVRNAINGKPDNAEYHTKLLEVFYTSGNKKAYEEEAKVLHDLVSGEGEHWDMAVAMWSEMSPNRALFEEGGAEDDDDDAADTTGGFVDVTADAEAADEDGLDFDIGAGTGEEESTLAESDEQTLDITAAGDGEDILDVTAAVGLEDLEEQDESAEDMLDISGSNAGEDLLDVTAVGSSEEDLDEDVLDVSSGGAGGDELLESTSEEEADEDLLDVSASSDLELDSNEDLLDVTAATGAGADSDELLDLEIEDTVADTEHDAGEADNVIDFDLASSGDEDESEHSLDMEATAVDSDEDADGGLELDLGETDAGTEDSGLELDLSSDADEEEAGLELDLGDTGADSDTDSDEPIRLDMELEDENADEESDAGDLSIDLEDSILSESAESEKAEDTPAMDFDLSIDEGSEGADSELEDGTLELEPPKLEMEDEDDDDGDHTVFVPRAAQPDEQSVEDEIATKLDLAKAYVELGDKDSAKTILDEVMVDGNDEQKQQAQDLMGQI